MKPKKPTGPRSAEGKTRSSMNALKSGIYSQSIVIPGEDPEALSALSAEYHQRFQPVHPEQRDQVDILIRSTWTLRRLAVAEAQVWGYVTDLAGNLDEPTPLGHAFYKSDRTLTRLQRIVNTTQRNYRDALHELERLQALDSPEPQPPAVAVSKPGPIPVPDLVAPAQPIYPQPINRAQEFVSSTSAPPPPRPPEAVPNMPPDSLADPLPFPKPGGIHPFPTQPKK